MKIFRPISRKYLSYLVAIVLPAVLHSGCGGNSMGMTPPSPTLQNTSFAFIANANSNTISAFQIDRMNGKPFAVMGSPFATGSAPEFMAADAKGEFLFVTNSNANNISVFKIENATGALTAAPGSPFATGTQPKGVVVVSSSNLVFVANNGSNDISAFKFDPATGALAAVPGSPFSGPFGLSGPIGTATDVLGKFLYVTNLNANSVSAFKIAPNGALTAVPGSPFATGSTPIGLSSDPNGMFLYVGNHMSDAVTPEDTISSFSVNGVTGALTATGKPQTLQSDCSVACHVNPLRLVMHPSGSFAYAANVGANTLSAFAVNNGGLLSLGNAVPTGQHPFGVAVEPSGNFVYVVNKVDNSISAFSVNAMTGMLSAIAGSPFPAGGNAPSGIIIVAHH
jgi:6-phosphogluconolactonase